MSEESERAQKLPAQLQELINTNKELSALNDQLQFKLLLKDQEVTEKSKEINHLKCKIADFIEEFRHEQLQYNEFLNQYEDLKYYCKKQQADHKTATNQLTQQHRDCNQENIKLKSIILKLKLELDIERRRNEKLEENLNTSNSDLHLSRKTTSNLQLRLQNIKCDTDQQSNEYHTLNGAYQKLRSEYQKLNSLYDAANQTNLDLQSDCSILHSSLTDVRRRYNIMLTRKEAEATTILPFEETKQEITTILPL